MFLFRPLAILSLLLIGGASSAWASEVAFGNGASLSLYGFTFAVSSCSLEISGTSESSCSGHNLELESVSTGRDTITIELAPTAGSYALQSTNGAMTSLSYTLTATQQTGATQFSAATLATTGSNAYSCPFHQSCSTTYSGAVSSSGTNFLTVALAQNQTSNSSSLYSQSPTVNGFAVQENVTLDGNNLANGSTLALSTLAMTMHTTPEPASVAILLVGLGSLAVARRRRRRG
jgi:hypothetical protein